MTLIEGFVRDEIFVDFGSEIMYGSDQQNVNYPSRFPTVEFQLIATFGLSQIADRIRKDAGFKPMHPMDEFTDDTCDNEGWYDFYVGINGFTHNHIREYQQLYTRNQKKRLSERTQKRLQKLKASNVKRCEELKKRYPLEGERTELDAGE